MSIYAELNGGVFNAHNALRERPLINAVDDQIASHALTMTEAQVLGLGTVEDASLEDSSVEGARPTQGLMENVADVT